MSALSCTGLPLASSLSVDSTSTCPKDGKSSNGVSRAAMEPACLGCCMQVSRSPIRNSLGLSRATGLSDGHSLKITSYRNEDVTSSRRRLETVQQAAPSTLNFPDRNSLMNLESGAVLDASGTKQILF